MNDTFWNDEIETLQETYGNDKFQMKYILSREDRTSEDNKYLHGRIKSDVLKGLFQPPIHENARFLVVGTKEMIRTTEIMIINDLDYE